MNKIIRVIEYRVGETIHGASVKIKYDGKCDTWDIIKGQRDQRDQTDSIFGLTDEIILNMAEAVNEKNRIIKGTSKQ
jgi:hypothetical protein